MKAIKCGYCNKVLAAPDKSPGEDAVRLVGFQHDWTCRDCAELLREQSKMGAT